MLTQAGCQGRQDRFRHVLETLELDAALVTDQNEIYYLTGFLIPDWMAFPAALFLPVKGPSWLVAQTSDGPALVDQRLVYEPHLLFTRNPDCLRRAADVIRAKLAGTSINRVGWQAEYAPRLICDAVAESAHPTEWIAIDDEIAVLERTKDPDEVECLRLSIACTLAAYDAAQLAIAPRVSEIIVLQAGQRSASLRAGEQVFHSGDYRAGELGGPARDRPMIEDELYIIDAWTHYHGYWSDLCRTFAIGESSPLQHEVYTHLSDIMTEVEGQLGPGLAGTDLWGWIDDRIREHPHLRDIGLTHHAGHGVGLRAHEGPDLNRDRGPELQPGDVISVEPGAYSPELRSGIRLENTFLITETGCELLSAYPLSLVRQT